MIKWDLSNGCKDGSISTNRRDIFHINKLRKKNFMIVSINVEKAFNKIQHLRMIKETLNKVHIEGTYLNIKKATYKPTANMVGSMV